jgi:hypothetical protein
MKRKGETSVEFRAACIIRQYISIPLIASNARAVSTRATALIHRLLYMF